MSADSPTERTPAFFEGQLPVAAILAAFLTLTLPLIALEFLWGGSREAHFVLNVYLIVLGISHFVLTGVVYLQVENLRYFAGTWHNRLIFFAAPLVLFLLFDLYSAVRVAALFPTAHLVVLWVIRFLDFNHSTRQSLGVLQLLKLRSGATFPPWLRRVEGWFFFSATVLMLLTYMLGGRFRPDHPAVLLLLGVVLVLALVVAGGFALTLRHCANKSDLAAPFAYLAIQVACVALTSYSTALYAACLATHYIEYHLLMIPRCFHTRLDPKHPADRLFAWLRRSQIVFYGVTLALACVIFYLTQQSRAIVTDPAAAADTRYLLLVSAFNGIFVSHYLIETYIWKFGDPHFRKTLAPLYLSPTEETPHGSHA